MDITVTEQLTHQLCKFEHILTVRIRDSWMYSVQLLSVVENEEQAEAEHAHDVSRQRQQEQEEVTVVPPADAVINPRAVMIKILRKKGQENNCVHVWQGERESMSLRLSKASPLL